MMKQSLESRDRIFSYKTLINNDNIYTIKSFFPYLFFFIDYVKVFILFYSTVDRYGPAVPACAAHDKPVRLQLRCCTSGHYVSTAPLEFIFSKKFVVVSRLIFLIKAFLMEWSLVWGSTTKNYAKYSINTC